MMMISAFLSTPTIPLVFHDYQTKQHPFLSPHPSTLLFLKNKFHKKRDCPFGNSVLIICRASGSSDGSSPPLILEQYPSSQVEQRMKDLAVCNNICIFIQIKHQYQKREQILTTENQMIFTSNFIRKDALFLLICRKAWFYRLPFSFSFQMT